MITWVNALLILSMCVLFFSLGGLTNISWTRRHRRIEQQKKIYSRAKAHWNTFGPCAPQCYSECEGYCSAAAKTAIPEDVQ